MFSIFMLDSFNIFSDIYTSGLYFFEKTFIPATWSIWACVTKTISISSGFIPIDFKLFSAF